MAVSINDSSTAQAVWDQLTPAAGIPATDLAASVQTSLGKADTALQPGTLPAGTTLPAAQISDATAVGRAVLTAADQAAQRMAMGAMAATLAGWQAAFDAAPAGEQAVARASVSGAVNSGPTVLGLFGDSRTYYSHVTDAGTLGVTYPAQEVATTRDDLSANGLAHHMQVISGGAIICPRRCNFGIHGEKTDSMLARAPAAAAAMRLAGATRVLMLMSTNDRTVAPPLTATQSIANISGIVAAFLAAGIRVSIVAELPRGDATYTAFRLTDAQWRDHMRVRRHILSMHDGCNVLAVDAWTDVANLASNSGDIRLGYTYDGIHLAGVAAARVARRAWDQLSLVIPPYRYTPGGVRDTWNADNPGASIVFNPNMTGTGGVLGGHTGVIADAWTGGSAIANLTITASKVTDSLGVEAQQFVIAGTTAPAALATTDLMRQDRNIGTQGLAIGGKVRAVGELEIGAGASGIRCIDAYVAASGMSARAGGGAANAADTIISTDAHAGYFVSEAITIPPGTTAVRTGVRLMVGGTATTGATVRIKWLALEHVV